ncbi:MAG TPA: hypothetical protein VFZ78_10160 [Flavisolibacter sp.]
MKIFLRSEKTIKDINRELAAVFPYLRLGFFRKPHKVHEGSPARDEVPACTQLIEITGILREVVVELKGSDTVSSVEQKFQDVIGIPVQVFRRQRGTWLETIGSDDRTLDEQNALGEEASHVPRRDYSAFEADMP